MPAQNPRLVTLDTPADFEIRVQGLLDASWSEYLGGAIIQKTGTAEMPVTVLRCRFQDQAALAGALNTLYDLGLPLLFVECLNTPPQNATTNITSTGVTK